MNILRHFLQGIVGPQVSGAAEQGFHLTTAYDRVAYPTTLFAQTHPERLAVLAQLAGLDPVPPERSRILEIGGGSCLNLLSLAAIWPECEAHGFDLSESAIARAQQIADMAGLDHAVLAVEDICAAHERYPAGAFDYVIVHGVYAWVPDHVRAATMQLIAHVLSARGVAFVSFNCMPGGHIRLIMREMLLDTFGGIEDPEVKIAATRDFLESYALSQPDDEPLATALRRHAESMLMRPDAVLFHDELGEHYHPQRMLDVADEAARHRLKFLTDAGRNRHFDGFLSDGAEVPQDAKGPDAEATVLLAASQDDYRSLRFFRQSLFVGEHQPVDRRIDVTRMEGLWLSTKLARQADGSFTQAGDSIEIADELLAAALERTAGAYPQRVPLSEVTSDPDHLRVILQLFAEWYVNLHPGPAPFTAGPGSRPIASPLVRGMIEMGELTVCTLEHGLLKIEQAELRALLVACDGTRTLAGIAAAPHGIPPEDVEAALIASAARALLSV